MRIGLVLLFLSLGFLVVACEDQSSIYMVGNTHGSGGNCGVIDYQVYTDDAGSRVVNLSDNSNESYVEDLTC